MIDRAVFRLPGIRGALLLTCGFAVLRALLILGQAFGLAFAIVGLWEGEAFAAQAGWVALFFACFVLRQVVASLQSARLETYARERADDLREQLLQLTFAQGPALVARHGSAAVVATAIEGVENVQTYIGLIIPKIVAVAVIPFVLLIAIFPLDAVSGVIALVCFPFIILYMKMIGYTAQDDAAKRYGEFQRMTNHFLDAVGGIDTLRAFGQSRAYGQRVFAASERLRELTVKTLRIATLSSAVLDVFATLALAGVAVMLGFRMVAGSVALLPALIILMLVPEYFRPIREFASDYHASLDGRSALAVIREILGVCDGAAAEAEEGLESAKSAVEQGAEFKKAVENAEGGECVLHGEAPAEGSLRLAASVAFAGAAAPSLEFRNVGFSYPDFPEALSDVSFSVEGPCKVAVIGASGSGKSTLVRLLGGFDSPTAGEVRVDGQPAASLRSASWQNRAAFIPQNPYIFHASLRDNVVFYCPQAIDAQVRQALELAGLAELAAELPQGMNTLIGQGGRALSGGQAHRVALARAFLDESRRVLLFDEPTAHLDIETEYELKQRMLPLMEGKLVFFATHRLHWVADMDYALEMADGRIAWQGPVEEWRKRGAR